MIPIHGARGSEQLAPEQKPRRRRKRRGRAQPYRKGGERESGPTLSAMLRGGPFYLPNPMDLKRQAQKQGRR